jgi:hypothetical protein
MRSLSTFTVSGTIIAGGVSQEIAPRNPRRDLLLLQNPAGESGALFFAFGAPATNTSLALAPGERVQFDQAGAVPTEAVHVLAADTDHAYTLLVGQTGAIE